MSNSTEKQQTSGAKGYHVGSVDTVISVEDVIQQEEQLGDGVALDEIRALFESLS